MDTILNAKQYYSKLETICKEKEIELLDHLTENNECYITFKYEKNNNFFNHLLLLREKEYVFHFKKKEKTTQLIISGKQNLIKDILQILDQKEKHYNDIDAILAFIDTNEEDVSIISYFNGIIYTYEISENQYGKALEYYDFAYDGTRYRYQINNYESFYEILKTVNKNIEVYKSLMKDTKIIEASEKIEKNINIQLIKEEYQKKGNKELYIIYKNSKYYIITKINNNINIYQYDNESKIKTIIPDLFELYLKDQKETSKSEIHSCLGRGFYMNILNDNQKLFIYNIEEEQLDYYIEYLKKISQEILKKREYNKNEVRIIKQYNKNAGYVNILFLSISVLIFSIFISLITLSLLK